MAGGRCRKFRKETAVAIVNAKNTITPMAPGLGRTVSVWATGVFCGIPKCMMMAGTSQFTSDGTKSAKNSRNVTLSFCQTIRVVMSPKGENAPPAFAATTMLMKPMATNFGESLPIARTTAPITRDVVRLSSTPERKNARVPVIQNRLR